MKNRYPIDPNLVLLVVFLLIVNLLAVAFSSQLEPIINKINSPTFNSVNSLLLLIMSFAIAFVLFKALNKISPLGKDDIDRLQNTLISLEALGQSQSDHLPGESRFYILRDELVRIETSVRVGSIVVFASDISPDTQDPWLSVIRDNLRKGIQYKYILPKTELAKGRFKALVNKFTSIPDLERKLIPLFIPEHLLISSITLYRSQEQGVLSIPNKHFEHKYYITIEKDFFPQINRYIERIEEDYGVVAIA